MWAIVCQDGTAVVNGNRISWYNLGMGRYAWYFGTKSILMKYRDKILKLSLGLPTYIIT